MPSDSPRSILILGVCTGAVLSAAASQALAWGATGHRLIGEAAIATLPAELPPFLRTPAAVQAVGELAREADRSKGAGQPHDHDLDPGHYLDLDDQGKVNGGPPLAGLPANHEDYEVALKAVQSDSYKSGYLPYTIEDGFEQVVKDFAYWRIETAALKTSPDARQSAWIAQDLKLREALTVRDVGYWAHFVGDGSQPLHVSVHFNGWGDYPNPDGYTQDKLHGPFEGRFVHDHVTLAGVEAVMSPLQPCAPIASCTAAYLAATNSYVRPLYAMWGRGQFAKADLQSVAFTTARVADGAAELRDMIAAAWRASADASIGHNPQISVRAAEAGQTVPFAALYGDD